MLALKGNNQYPGEKWQLLLVELSAVNLTDVMPLKRIASTNLLLFLWLPFYSIIQSIHQYGNLHFPWYNYFKATFNYFASILPFVFPWQWCPIENLWFKYHNWIKGKCTVQLIIIVKYSESGVISSGIFGLYDPKHSSNCDQMKYPCYSYMQQMRRDPIFSSAQESKVEKWFSYLTLTCIDFLFVSYAPNCHW